MAFADAFDMAFTQKHDLEPMLNFTNVLSMMADSRSVFGVATRISNITENIQIIDLGNAKETYTFLGVKYIAPIQTK